MVNNIQESSSPKKTCGITNKNGEKVPDIIEHIGDKTPFAKSMSGNSPSKATEISINKDAPEIAKTTPDGANTTTNGGDHSLVIILMSKVHSTRLDQKVPVPK